jgi:hypothetical protein
VRYRFMMMYTVIDSHGMDAIEEYRDWVITRNHF